MVIDLEPIRGCYADSWFEPKAPHDSPKAVQTNRELVARLDRRFRPDDGHPRHTEAQNHSVAEGVPLRLVSEELLTRLRVTRLVDSVQFTDLLLQVGRSLEQHPDATCIVYRMSGGTTRERSADDDLSREPGGPPPGRAHSPDSYAEGKAGCHYPSRRRTRHCRLGSSRDGGRLGESAAATAELMTDVGPCLALRGASATRCGPGHRVAVLGRADTRLRAAPTRQRWSGGAVAPCHGR